MSFVDRRREISDQVRHRIREIVLDRQKLQADRRSRLDEFLRLHRLRILSEIGWLLSQDVGEVAAQTRWAAWEREVLARCTNRLGAVQSLVRERQADLDVDDDEVDLIREAFREEVAKRDKQPDTSSMVFSSSEVAELLQRVLGVPYSTIKASRHLGRLGIPELTKYDRKDRRGWLWTDLDASQRSAEGSRRRRD